MRDVNALIESAQQKGLRLFVSEGKVKVKAPHPLDGDTKALIEKLREHKEAIRSILATSELTRDHIASTFFTVEERLRWVVLVVNRPERLPQAPITVNPGLKIVDVAQFTKSTIQDLARYVTAKNRGVNHWFEMVLDEKLAQLQQCGVKAEIRTIQ